MTYLGDMLRDQRARKRWTQDRVAAACGITRQQVGRYETGVVTPDWSTFVRILACFGCQPRIDLEPLDADVTAAIERQRRKSRHQWLSDVGLAADLVHRLLDGLTWRATGLLAARLFGAPAPLRELEVEAVIDDADAWTRLTRNAFAIMTPVWDPDEWFASAPTSPQTLRRVSAAGHGILRWPTGIGVDLVFRVVAALKGQTVAIDVGDSTWDVVGLDQLVVDDPWTQRVLAQLRGDSDASVGQSACGNSGDSVGRSA